MSPRRKRTTQRRNPSQELMDEARRRIESGESKRSVASSFGMAESTLRKNLKRLNVSSKLGRFDTTFTPEIEDDEVCRAPN